MLLSSIVCHYPHADITSTCAFCGHCLLSRFKNRQCIDESEVESAITRRYLEHVMRLSLVQDGSRVGPNFRDVGTHALGTVPEFYRLPLSHGVLVRLLRFD